MALTEYSKTYVPIYLNLVEISKKHEDIHWTENEAKLQDDVEQWKSKKLTPEEYSLVSNVLKLFTQSDVAVGEAYYDKLIPVIKNNEARNMLGSFAAREAIHQRAYALLNDTLGLGEESYTEFLDYQSMAEKIEFMANRDLDLSEPEDFATYLTTQVFMEGVCLFASFAMLLNFDRMGKMKGMSDIVRWSMKDETVHVEGLVALFKIFCQENDVELPAIRDTVLELAAHINHLEQEFIKKAFELGEVEGLNAEQVVDYIQYVTNYRLQQLGFEVKNNLENPIPWIDVLMAGTTHSNFFEREVTDYSKDNFEGDWF